MASGQTKRRMYSAEALHQLRNAYSLPKLEEAIEEHDGKDAEVLKEHVLRGSKSFTARSFRSRNSTRSLRVPSATSNDENLPPPAQRANRTSQSDSRQPPGAVLSEVAANNQTLRPLFYKLGPSPTPSMKKRKAEAIVKAHGSPTHIRVTAGGRIVPSEQSPLCYPRYGYSAVKVNGGLIKFAPNYHAGKAQWTKATENGFVAQDVHGNLCQIVNGTVLPLNQVDGALRLYVPAPNLNVTHRGPSQGPGNAFSGPHDNHQTTDSEIEPAAPLEPSLSSQIGALELEYSKLEQELKDVDKTEVIHGRAMGKSAKDALVSRRRELVTSMDKVRKALKALKNQPPPNAPTSPRAMAHTRTTTSPSPANRLPAFLAQRPTEDAMNISSHQHLYGLYGNAPLPMHFNSTYGFQPVPMLNEFYTGPPWGYANSGMFVPSPYDGALSGPPSHLQDAELAAAFQQMPISEPAAAGINVPQHDGGSSQAGSHLRSPSRSHAVPIRAPDDNAPGQKSTLNPMSPAYKPTHDSKPETRKSVNQSDESSSSKRSYEASVEPQTQSKAQGRAAGDSSPTKRGIHMQSSSISSFDTADFFPRNTFEYSTRQRSLSRHHYTIDDKENKDPETAALPHGARPNTPGQEISIKKGETSRGGRFANMHSLQMEQHQPPAPPPGTPVHLTDAASKSSTSIEIDNAVWYRKSKVIEHIGSEDVPNRADHNVSPKNKWSLLENEQHAKRQQNLKGPSLDDPCHSQEEQKHGKMPVSMIDFTQKPREWIEGYQAGLRRQPVEADRYGDFLDGYCEGLLKSKPDTSELSSNGPSTGSPSRSTARRPLPVGLPSSSMRQREEKMYQDFRAQIDAIQDQTGRLKQAIIAPHNEDAILTPSTEGPHVNEHPFNLGAWAKNHGPQIGDGDLRASRFFSESKVSIPTVSIPDNRRVISECHVPHSHQYETSPLDVVTEPDSHTQSACSPRLPEDARPHTKSPVSLTPPQSTAHSTTNLSHAETRIGSMLSMDSALDRSWPGHRVFSPQLDVKPTSSISRAASVATGYFSHAQTDGAPHNNRITSTASTTVVPTNAHGRFNDVPPNRVMSFHSSPHANSPNQSPKRAPVKESPRRRPGVHGKASSPAKTTFDNLAEKVGIKVSPNVKVHADDGAIPGAEHTSPSGKRRWRDVWRGGVRREDGH